MTHDKVRQDFEAWAIENDYCGYLDEKHHAWQGYQAGRAAERAEIREKLESEGVTEEQKSLELICNSVAMLKLERALARIDVLEERLRKLSDPLLNYPPNASGTAGCLHTIKSMADDAKAAITKILEVI